MKDVIIVFVVAFCTLCQANSLSCDDTLVEVEQGVLAGQKLTAVGYNTTYYSFRGIPYAKPPVGDLRFKAPVTPESWEGIRDATQFGNVCPEYNPVTKLLTKGSEDCLYLNVDTPNTTPDKPLPVMVFIGGYSFLFDTGVLNVYGSDFLVAKDVVVVTSKSRQDSLGFLCLDSEDVPGNAGLKDQVAVLKWVNKNIAQFGGDPNCVTLFGHSSGGASVAYHTTSPMSKNLFHRAIVMSGVPDCDAVYSHKVKERSFLLGKLLGLDTKNSTELLLYLQSLPYEKFINQTAALTISEEIANRVLFKKMAPFVGTVEKDFGQDRFITEQPLSAYKNGNVNPVDVMFSYSNQESVLAIAEYMKSIVELYNRYPELFVPFKITIASPPDTIADLANDIVNYYFEDKAVSTDNIDEYIKYSNAAIAVDVHRYIGQWPRPGSTYLFKYSTYSSRNLYGVQGVPYDIEGAAHGDILSYIFNPTDMDMPLQKGSAEFMMVEQIVSALTNFAKYGNPTPDNSLGVDWPQYDTKTKAYAEFRDFVQVGNAPDEEELQFWKNIFQKGGIEF